MPEIKHIFNMFLNNPKFPLNMLNPNGDTLLSMACLCERWDIAEYLISLDGIDINIGKTYNPIESSYKKK